MGYRDRFQQASFRNVQFFVSTHSMEGGRRIVNHEFPDRDDPATEDMGRKSRTFSIDGYVIGENYFATRDQLVRALEKKTFGVLVHPFLGRKDVRVTGFTLNESMAEGRVAQFSMSFCERGRPTNPIGFLGPVFAFIEQANDFINDIQEEFEAIYEIASMPGYLADSALGMVSSVTDTFNEAVGIIPATAATFNDVKNGILDYGTTMPATINSATSVFTSTHNTEISISKITNDAIHKQKMFGVGRPGSLIDFGDNFPDPPIQTAFRKQEKKNTDAFKRMVQGIAIQQAAKWFVLSVTQPVDITNDEQRNLENNSIFSIDDLQRQRDELVKVMDAYLEKHGNFASRDSFIKMRAGMINALPKDETTTDLKRSRRIHPNETLPALILVYNQFKKINSEEDFIRRNKIQHPAFVKGGVDYEIVEVK